ncbi:MAG: TrmH family RNA methyltransferase [Betaproteobacteria bacterium]
MKRIASRDNGFFKELKRLAHTGRERRKSGRTVLDGIHLISAYEETRGPVEHLIVDESALDRQEIAALIAGREPLLLPAALFRDISPVESPAGVVAVVPVPPVAAPDFSIDTLLLDGVQDPGNVGTMLRTAVAAGFRQILLSGDCAAAWSPKVLRAGQGAHFLASIVEDADLGDFLCRFQGTTAVTQLREAVSLYEARLDGAMAWVFGSEGQGVRPEISAAAQLKVKIPMPGAVESLNVAAASAICLFETVRRRSA